MARVLLAEDDETLQAAYGLALTQAGYTVDMASDGGQALQLAAGNQPDLVLLDLLMPNHSGVEFLEKYDLKAHPDVKVVVFTNMVAPATVEKVKQLGAHQCLTKSDYTPAQILEIIETELKSA